MVFLLVIPLSVLPSVEQALDIPAAVFQLGHQLDFGVGEPGEDDRFAGGRTHIETCGFQDANRIGGLFQVGCPIRCR